jgi:hypothetical protein
VHVAIDDATRLAYIEVLTDEKALTATGFLRRAVAHFASYGINVERLITDNGSAYRSAIHAIACRTLGVRHLRTRPYRPQTNGKAERFIRTLLGGWAYGAIYRDSAERNAALAGWLDFYNRRRPHGALSHKPPIAHLNELNNPPRRVHAARRISGRRASSGKPLGDPNVPRAATAGVVIPLLPSRILAAELRPSKAATRPRVFDPRSEAKHAHQQALKNCGKLRR